ncbi:zinc finger protein [Trichonephila inaurata madagascariensis]|uniref:Zinc finger protein n=1 Tax=Trichonephila inaurata madagascariensis TaxID=2747483 RepID=A0A8X7C1X1_9ARAC|nr:zinc finger protein [Trichonephila inaurata madagascariensis]
MEPSAGEYRCDYCKLQFKHYKQFLSHKYLNHDEQELQPEIYSEVTQSEPEDISFASNSSLENSNVHLEEAPKRHTSYGLLLNNKMDYIHGQFYNENTHKYGSGENRLERNLSPNRYSYIDIGKDPNDSCGFENRLNQKSDLIKNILTHSAEKTSMEYSNGKHRCNSCKLQFKHYKQFLSHKYLNHDEQELQPEINYHGEASQNPLNNFKSSCEMHIGKIPLKEQLKNNERTDSSEYVYNPFFDSRDRESIESHYGLITESKSTLSCLVSTIEHSQEPRSRGESNPEVTANERSLSLKYNQAEIYRLEGNTGVNRSQSSILHEDKQLEICRLVENTGVNRCESTILSEYNQMQIYTQGISEQFNGYQSSTTEYGETCGNYRQMDVNLPSTSYVMRPMIAIKPQFHRYHCALFFEYNPLQFIGCEMNHYFNTNQIPMPLGYRQKEFDHYDLYRQSKPNLLSMSPECREMDLNTHVMNPQINANSQAVTEKNDNIPLPERNLSPKQWILNKVDINLQENSIESRRNLYSVDRSNIIYGEPKTLKIMRKM